MKNFQGVRPNLALVWMATEDAWKTNLAELTQIGPQLNGVALYLFQTQKRRMTHTNLHFVVHCLGSCDELWKLLQREHGDTESTKELD